MDQSILSNALCVVSHVETVDTRDQSMSCFNGSNAMLCRYSRYKMHIHVHMFLPITFLIFNRFFKSIEILRLVLTVSTYIGFGGMVGKP